MHLESSQAVDSAIGLGKYLYFLTSSHGHIGGT